MKLVSIVIPTYNQVNYVVETIDSVLAQTYPHLEIIVTDDGSTDGTIEVINRYEQSYPGKIVAVYSAVNTGIAANINRGLARVRGDYVAWLGGDDLMYPGKISLQVEALEGNSRHVGCHHDADVFDQESNTIVGSFSELYGAGRKTLPEGDIDIFFDPGVYLLPSTIMFRRSAMPSHGFDVRLKYSNDWLFDIETFRHGPIMALNKVLGLYRRHAKNVTSSNDLLARSLEESLIVLGIVQARYPQLSSLVRKRRRAFLQTAMMKLLRSDNTSHAWYHLKGAICDGAWIKAPVLYFLMRYAAKHMRIFESSGYEQKKILRKIRNFIKV